MSGGLRQTAKSPKIWTEYFPSIQLTGERKLQETGEPLERLEHSSSMVLVTSLVVCFVGCWAVSLTPTYILIIVKMSPTLPDSSGRKTGALWNKGSKAQSWCRVGNQAVSHESAQETQETCWTLQVHWRGLSRRENWTECGPRPHLTKLTSQREQTIYKQFTSISAWSFRIP